MTNPDKVYFPDAEVRPITKLEVVEYWATVAEAALPGAATGPAPAPLPRRGRRRRRRVVLSEAVSRRGAGVGADRHHHVPERTARAMPVMHDEAALVWAATLGCLECQPVAGARRRRRLTPMSLRVDLDPTPGVPWDDVRRWR